MISAFVAQDLLETPLNDGLDEILRLFCVIDVGKVSVWPFAFKEFTQRRPSVRGLEDQELLGWDRRPDRLRVLVESLDQVIAIVHPIVEIIVDGRLHEWTGLGLGKILHPVRCKNGVLQGLKPLLWITHGKNEFRLRIFFGESGIAGAGRKIYGGGIPLENGVPVRASR